MIQLLLFRCSVSAQSCCELGCFAASAQTMRQLSYKSNRSIAGSLVSYPDSVGLFSICTRHSVGAHLEHVTARFVANLACLAMVRASLSWFGISLPLPKCISSGDCPLNAEYRA